MQQPNKSPRKILKQEFDLDLKAADDGKVC